jgi:ArsR family transcriptional regulator
MENLTSYFKGLADEKRLRILNLLFQGELCGCDIQLVLDATQSNVSRHLSYLKNAGLVADRRVANRVYYRLEHKGADGTGGLLAFLEVVFGDNSVLREDRKRLLAAIKDGSCSTADLPEKKPGVTRKRASKKR